MKVIISCLNSKFVHASLSPWCLLAGVKEYCKKQYDICVLESSINDNMGAFAQRIMEEKPDVVAFSCYIWNITKTLELCRILKQTHPCKIVLGGPEVAYRPKNVLENYEFVDFVLSGEGEWTFPDFLNNLNGDLSCVSGLSFRQSGEIITIPETEYRIDPPSPFCNEFFEKLNGRIAYIETARGCPYSCAFCLSGRCSPLRFFSLSRVKADLLKLSSSGTRTVKFVDRTFNANEQRANEILLFIKENYGKKIPENVCFHFEIAGDILKESTLDILACMPKGAVQLEIGMQSFNAEVLKYINRKTNINKLIENIKKLVGFNNMHIHIDLIAGLTGEDIESFKNGFNIAFSLKAHMLQMGFLKLLYGADMRENHEKYPCTFTPEPPYEVTSTPCLVADEIKMLKNCEDALDRLYNSGRFLFSLEYLIDETGISPFDVFNDFGNYVNGDKMQLCNYAEKFYEFFRDKCDADILRGKIVCDLLSSGAFLQIPVSFKIYDPFYKSAKNYFAKTLDNGVKIAILYSTNEVFVINPSKEKSLHNRFEGELYSIEKLKELISQQ